MQTMVLGAIALVVVQTLLIVTQGEPACFNQGCRVVEGLTRISPLWFNLLGLAYFVGLGTALFFHPVAEPIPGRICSLLLSAGAGMEGVLFSYQMVVAQTFCGYCLVIFVVLLSLNLLAGLRQAAGFLAAFAGALVIFPTLHFGPGALAGRGLSLSDGTWGSVRPAQPTHEGFLFFSESCEHCRNVLRSLPKESGCMLHLNPISNHVLEPLPGVTPEPSFQPEVNQAMLSLLGLDEIPVLLVKTGDTLRIIHGEKPITAFFQAECSGAAAIPLPPSTAAAQSSVDNAGECSAETERCASP